MSTEIDELKQARYRSGKTISGHNAFLRPPTGETNSVDTRGFYFVLKEPHPNNIGAQSCWAAYGYGDASACIALAPTFTISGISELRGLLGCEANRSTIGSSASVLAHAPTSQARHTRPACRVKFRRRPRTPQNP